MTKCTSHKNTFINFRLFLLGRGKTDLTGLGHKKSENIWILHYMAISRVRLFGLKKTNVLLGKYHWASIIKATRAKSVKYIWNDIN